MTFDPQLVFFFFFKWNQTGDIIERGDAVALTETNCVNLI